MKINDIIKIIKRLNIRTDGDKKLIISTLKSIGNHGIENERKNIAFEKSMAIRDKLNKIEFKMNDILIKGSLNEKEAIKRSNEILKLRIKLPKLYRERLNEPFIIRSGKIISSPVEINKIRNIPYLLDMQRSREYKEHYGRFILQLNKNVTSNKITKGEGILRAIKKRDRLQALGIGMPFGIYFTSYNDIRSLWRKFLVGDISQKTLRHRLNNNKLINFKEDIKSKTFRNDRPEGIIQAPTQNNHSEIFMTESQVRTIV